MCILCIAVETSCLQFPLVQWLRYAPTSLYSLQNIQISALGVTAQARSVGLWWSDITKHVVAGIRAARLVECCRRWADRQWSGACTSPYTRTGSERGVWFRGEMRTAFGRARVSSPCEQSQLSEWEIGWYRGMSGVDSAEQISSRREALDAALGSQRLAAGFAGAE